MYRFLLVIFIAVTLLSALACNGCSSGSSGSAASSTSTTATRQLRIDLPNGIASGIFVHGQAIYFSFFAYDDNERMYDEDIALASWESSLDGLFAETRTTTEADLTLGEHTITALVVSLDGRSTNVTFKITIIQPENTITATISLHPPLLIADTRTYFSLDLTRSHDTIYTDAIQHKWDWQWGNGLSEIDDSNTFVADTSSFHNYTSPGQHTIWLVATNHQLPGSGISQYDTTTLTIEIIAGELAGYTTPELSGTIKLYPDSGNKYTPFTFDCSDVYDLTPGQLLYSWKADDSLKYSPFDTSQIIVHYFDLNPEIFGSTYVAELPDGTTVPRTMTIRVLNQDSGRFDVQSLSFNWQHLINAAPVAIITADPTQGEIDSHFAFDGDKGYDDDPSDTLRYRWDFNGDHKWDTPYTESSSTSFRYQQAGTYTVYLEVSDPAGATALDSTEVIVYEPLTADWTALPESVTTAQSTDFIPSVENSDQFAALEMAWKWSLSDTFGDYTPLGIKSHSWSRAGIHNITLHVREQGGIAEQYVLKQYAVSEAEADYTLSTQNIRLADSTTLAAEVSITNSGTGTLYWQSSGSAPWLEATDNHSGNLAPGNSMNIGMQALRAGLANGSYQGMLNIHAAGRTEQVSVNLDIASNSFANQVEEIRFISPLKIALGSNQDQLFLAEGENGMLSHYSISQKKVLERYEIGLYCGELLFVPGYNYLLAADTWGDSVVIFSVTDHLEEVAILQVGESPAQMTLSPDGQAVYITSFYTNSSYRLDLESFTYDIFTDLLNPTAISCFIDSDGEEYSYVLNQGSNSISIVYDNYSLQGEYSFDAGSTPNDLLIGNERLLYATNSADSTLLFFDHDFSRYQLRKINSGVKLPAAAAELYIFNDQLFIRYDDYPMFSTMPITANLETADIRDIPLGANPEERSGDIVYLPETDQIISSSSKNTSLDHISMTGQVISTTKFDGGPDQILEGPNGELYIRCRTTNSLTRYDSSSLAPHRVRTLSSDIFAILPPSSQNKAIAASRDSIYLLDIESSTSDRLITSNRSWISSLTSNAGIIYFSDLEELVTLTPDSSTESGFRLATAPFPGLLEVFFVPELSLLYAIFYERSNNEYLLAAYQPGAYDNPIASYSFGVTYPFCDNRAGTLTAVLENERRILVFTTDGLTLRGEIALPQGELKETTAARLGPQGRFLYLLSGQQFDDTKLTVFDTVTMSQHQQIATYNYPSSLHISTTKKQLYLISSFSNWITVLGY